ncbi:malonyl-ACP O-methyltransferase BioC [Pelodictyon phaeoclathratiforme]|jgi:malonyl-CoA O-methyltransferase|uniref:Malonyl-[acyl-carrier protein] O-methyltransferase n=1 Tax=Pelodictyon phaeoclathratiforme (strain DSM 5477 / BU-1) TaxID=324925 RepID=B4SGZ4_PELPB|nr:malonyl-ACP O-methyltransferase BioC [Pelodictyon phaeoclathratiforme]ACF44982.1 biotin biosynthesis protein BioC [Pelodictyon phaeoclathratiforme BU-1]MBV5288667.1 malonyl-ACP O-methyltransferase BioC [Pelodictyon phaeoclathratiforme]
MYPLIDKELVRERFCRTLGSYGSNAVVQKAMAGELAELICKQEPGFSFERVLEVGAGSGALMAELLHRRSVKAYYANDLVEESRISLQGVLDRFPVGEFHFLAGDIETLELLPFSLDLVASNATLQWLDDLDRFFGKISDHLRPGGMLAFSTFGPSNMREIASIEGVGLSYHTLRELELLASRYFDLVVSREEKIPMEFSSPEAMLHHIRKTGVNGLLRRSWTKSRYLHFIEEYRRRFSSENGVSLTYHPLYCCLKKRAS